MADGIEPVGLTLVVCDAIHVDPGSAKRTLLGTFANPIVPAFPYTMPSFAVYAAVTECLGTVSVGVKVIDANEERPPVLVADGVIECPDPLAVLEIDFRFGNVVFPEPGDYRVQLHSDGYPILARRIVVMSVDQIGEPE